MKDFYYRELAANIEHYTGRGYSLEQALIITLKSEEEVHRVYCIIQEEKKLPRYPRKNPFAFLEERKQ